MKTIIDKKLMLSTSQVTTHVAITERHKINQMNTVILKLKDCPHGMNTNT